MAEDSKNENGEKKTSGKPTDPCLLIDYVQELAQKSFDEYNSFGWSNFKTLMWIQKLHLLVLFLL